MERCSQGSPRCAQYRARQSLAPPQRLMDHSGATVRFPSYLEMTFENRDRICSEAMSMADIQAALADLPDQDRGTIAAWRAQFVAATRHARRSAPSIDEEIL